VIPLFLISDTLPLGAIVLTGNGGTYSTFPSMPSPLAMSGLPWTISLLTLALIAQAVFLFEHGQAHTHGNRKNFDANDNLTQSTAPTVVHR